MILNLLLLHAFPSSSHMYRNLIPLLADQYYLIAPNLSGFGFSDAPQREQFEYTFDHLARIIDRFTQTVGIDRYLIQRMDIRETVSNG